MSENILNSSTTQTSEKKNPYSVTSLINFKCLRFNLILSKFQANILCLSSLYMILFINYVQFFVVMPN